MGRPTSAEKYDFSAPTPPFTNQLHSGMHLPVKRTRRRCAKCSTNEVQVRSTIECSFCKLAFCVTDEKNCFYEYHKHFLQRFWVRIDKLTKRRDFQREKVGPERVKQLLENLTCLWLFYHDHLNGYHNLGAWSYLMRPLSKVETRRACLTHPHPSYCTPIYSKFFFRVGCLSWLPYQLN